MKIKTQNTREPLRLSGSGAKVKAKNLSKKSIDWQADCDARTMSDYQRIMGDPKRKAAAIKRAKELATELEERADAMRRAGQDIE